MMPSHGSVPSSSILSCLGRLPRPLSSYDARSGFCTILLHLILSWPSPSSLVQLWCQVRVLYHPPPSSPVLAVSLLPCPAMMPSQSSVPSSSIFSCLGRLLPPLSSYDAKSGFCTILLHLLLSWPSPSSLVQLWCQVRVLYHPSPSSPVLDVSFLPCPAMMPSQGSVPSSSIFSCLGRLPPPLSSYDAKSGFCTILLHLLLSWPSPSSLVQLGCQVGVLYHPPPSSPVLGVPHPRLSSYDARSGFCTILLHLLLSWPSPSSLVQLWCQVRVLYHPPPSSPVLGIPHPRLSSYDARSGFCTILLHLLLSWPSPSSLVQLWCQVRVLYHPPPSSPVLAVSLLPCPARMPGRGPVPSSSIFSCLGRLPPPLSSYDARSGFCTILLHLLLSWASPSSLVQLWCQVRVLYHPPPSSPVLGVSLLPCPAMMPGQGSVPSSCIFSCLGRLPPPLSSYDVKSGFCTILRHLLLSWASPSSKPHLSMSCLMLFTHLILALPFARVPPTFIVCFTLFLSSVLSTQTSATWRCDVFHSKFFPLFITSYQFSTTILTWCQSQTLTCGLPMKFFMCRRIQINVPKLKSENELLENVFLCRTQRTSSSCCATKNYKRYSVSLAQ